MSEIEETTNHMTDAATEDSALGGLGQHRKPRGLATSDGIDTVPLDPVDDSAYGFIFRIMNY